MNVFRACTGLGVFGFGDVGNQPFVNSKSPEGLIPLPSAEDIANFIESNGLTLTTFDTTRHFLGKDTIYDKKDGRNYDRLWFKIDEARRLLEKARALTSFTRMPALQPQFFTQLRQNWSFARPHRRANNK